MRYIDVAFWAKSYFEQLEYSPLPIFKPGPASDVLIQKAGANRLIFLSVGGGPGQNTEGAFDATFISARVIGKQMNYDDAETMARDLDRGLLALDHNGVMGSRPYLYVARSGGAPQLLQYDSANRYHFTCSYVINARSDTPVPSAFDAPPTLPDLDPDFDVDSYGNIIIDGGGPTETAGN